MKAFKLFGMILLPALIGACLISCAPTCSFPTSSYTLHVGETYTQTVTTDSDGDITYESSNPSVATVNASTGRVTAVAAGNATITATVKGIHASASASYNIIVIKVTGECSFPMSSHTLPVSDTYIQTVTTNSDGAVTYTSSDPSVASVEASTGKVTAIAEGKTTITATVAATGTYTATSASYDIVVDRCIDLGLSVKWAAYNVGATTPYEYGDYFAWGETKEKSNYSWSTYFDSVIGSNSNFKKYATNKKTALDPEDDAAHVNWGGTWRMPTDAELTELREKCTWTRTTKSGVKGYEVKSKTNGNSIFLPAAGYRDDSSLIGAGSTGDYWSSSLYGYSDIAWYVYFSSGCVGRNGSYRSYGLSVRAVCP